MFELMIMSSDENPFDNPSDYLYESPNEEELFIFYLDFKEIQLIDGSFKIIDREKLYKIIHPAQINNELLTLQFKINDNTLYILMPNINEYATVKLMRHFNDCGLIESGDKCLTVDEYLIKSILE